MSSETYGIQEYLGVADLGPHDKTDFFFFFPAGTVTRVCDGLAYS